MPLTSQAGLAQLVVGKAGVGEPEPAWHLLFRIRFGLDALLGRNGAEANWHRLERGWGLRPRVL